MNRSPEILPWSNISGELVAPIPKAHNTGVICITYNDDYFVSSSFDGSIKVWDLNYLKLKSNFNQVTNDEEAVPNIKMSTRCLQLKNNQLFSAGIDSTIKLWDLTSNKCSLVINNGRPIASILQNPLKSHLVYSCSTKEPGIKTWDIRLPTIPLTYYEEIRDCISYFVFDGSKFIVSGNSLSAFTISHDSTVNQHWNLHLDPLPATCNTMISTSSLLVHPALNWVSVLDFDIDPYL